MVLASYCAAQAQEALPREQALKAAFQLCRDLPKMLDTPIPTDPDVKRPVGVHAEKRGLLVFPESKLSLDAIAKAGPEVVPVGQLWMLKIVPMVDGQPVKAEQLHLVTVSGENETVDAALFAMGARKGSQGQPELLVYGKDKKPLLSLALKPISEKQENPIEASAERQGDGAEVTLKLFGKHAASFAIGASD